MMSADECRKRADACLAEAIRAVHLDDQRSWHALAELWLLRHDQLSDTPAIREWPAIAAEAKSGAAAAVAVAVTQNAISDNEMPSLTETETETETVTVTASETATSYDETSSLTGDRLRFLLGMTEGAPPDNKALSPAAGRLHSLLSGPVLRRIFKGA